MKKQTKTKITKRKKKQQKYFGETVYFEVILMVVLIPTIVLFLVPIFQKPLFKEIYKQPYGIVYKTDNKNSVEITTEKNVYKISDKMVLSIKNNSSDSIYFEPCEYLNNFEKKIDGVWVGEKSVVENKIYDSRNFKKEESITNCSVSLPKSGAGIYRAVVRIYYDCQTPGENMCSDSRVFYSNEFKIIDGENDFCEDKVLENCDGKRVSVTGVAVNSKTSFLSDLVGRDVKYAWFGGIMISDSEKPFGNVKLKDGEAYNIIGVISAGGGICGGGDRAEQCAGEHYPTIIEVEKVYPVE